MSFELLDDGRRTTYRTGRSGRYRSRVSTRHLLFALCEFYLKSTDSRTELLKELKELEEFNSNGEDSERDDLSLPEVSTLR